MIAVEAPPHLAGVGRYTYQRRHTRCVMVGDVGVGGEHPIRVQSMTTPATQDVAATVAQTIRLVAAGCEIVRVTVPTVTDARALRAIRAELHRCGVRVPLVADIHFSPAAALEASQHVEKVRVNPGNFADSKRFASPRVHRPAVRRGAGAGCQALCAPRAPVSGAWRGHAYWDQPRLALGPGAEPLR